MITIINFLLRPEKLIFSLDGYHLSKLRQYNAKPQLKTKV
jgi:hypothetical protein